MEYVFIKAENRLQATAFLAQHWYSTEMIIRGEIVDMTQIDGIIGYDNKQIVALLTYRIKDPICEIISLDSLLEGKGIATALIQKAIAIARQKQCKKMLVVTTNDNIKALRFYQKRGFDMARLYHNALDISRKLKPEIPQLGADNIPLQHEIEFEYNLL